MLENKIKLNNFSSWLRVQESISIPENLVVSQLEKFYSIFFPTGRPGFFSNACWKLAVIKLFKVNTFLKPVKFPSYTSCRACYETTSQNSTASWRSLIYHQHYTLHLGCWRFSPASFLLDSSSEYLVSGNLLFCIILLD